MRIARGAQVYIAVVNYTLMTLTIVVVATFKTSLKLGRAYGVQPPGVLRD